MLDCPHIAHIANDATVDPFLDLEKARHCPTIEGDEQAHALLLAHIDDLATFLEAHRHRFLDIDVLASPCHLQRQRLVRRWRCCHIDGIDLGIGKQLLGRIAGGRHVVA